MSLTYFVVHKNCDFLNLGFVGICKFIETCLLNLFVHSLYTILLEFLRHNKSFLTLMWHEKTSLIKVWLIDF